MKLKNKILIVMLVLVLIACAALVPSRAEANLGETFYGVQVSNSENYYIPDNIAFPFDHIRFGLPAMWSAADPTKIVIPVSGVWVVGADMTSLGLNYQYMGGVDSSRVILEIVKNWCGLEFVCPHLYDDITFERFEYQNPYGANGNSTSSVVVLEQGDTLELILSGKTGGLMIESNPANGVLSPHFYAYYLGALP